MGNSEKESLGKPFGYEVIVRREAQLEVQEAFDYYEEKNKGLGFEFMRSLDAALQSVKRSPLAYQTIYKESRRVAASQISIRTFLSCRRKPNCRYRLFSPKTK